MICFRFRSNTITDFFLRTTNKRSDYAVVRMAIGFAEIKKSAGPIATSTAIINLLLLALLRERTHYTFNQMLAYVQLAAAY